MEIKLHVDVVTAVGEPLEAFGVCASDFNYRIKSKNASLDIARFSPEHLTKLRKLLAPHATMRGVGLALQNLDHWFEVLNSGGSNKAKSVDSFASILTEYLRTAPRHWIFQRDEDRDSWEPYYVTNVTYTPPKRYDGGVTPPYATMHLAQVDLASKEKSSVSFYAGDCVNKTAVEALTCKNFVVGTPEMFERYEEAEESYIETIKGIGVQFLATGKGWNLDEDSSRHSRRERYWWNRSYEVRFDVGEDPAHVVVDLFNESADADEENAVQTKVDASFWQKKFRKLKGDEDETPDEDEGEEKLFEDVPCTFNLVVFDLKRQMRLKCNLSQLTLYVYDKNLGDNLVLPADSKRLIDVLLSYRGGFTDVVRGKGGGAVILCSGIPGTGKTLTAEVYAEVMERPLYSVQASQLGLSSEALEESLLKVFARAHRWGAILLLDEADVYVATRGDSLVQNAIVGVFLRVLEYYHGILFMTTNRTELVDDAVASRCIAHITYETPKLMEQHRLWAILSKAVGVELSNGTIAEIVTKYPALTGRDVKNLLKLAKLTDETVTLQTIDFAKKFKPTK